jgi:MraZ protein
VPSLTGTFDLTIDEKNRMNIPAEVRRAIERNGNGNVLYAITGINNRPWLWPEKTYDAMASVRPSSLAPRPEDLEFDQANYALAHPIEWDKQGRVVIPEKVMRKGRLNREITLIAARDHLELWNRAEWQAHEEDLERRRPVLAARASVQSVQ